MESIFYTKYSSLLNCFFFIFFCFLLVLPVQADVWLLEPESQYIDIVEEIINNSRINYEKINTWQGELTIHEENEYYGESGQKYIKPDSPTAKSQHLKRSVDLKGNFYVDLKSNKLNSSLEPEVEWVAVDFGQKADLRDEISYSRMRAIVTNQEYLRYDPDLNFSYPSDFILTSETAGKTAFINPPAEAKGRLSGDIRDPREFFKIGGDFSWSSFSKIIKQIENYGNMPIGEEKVLRIWKNQKDDEIYKIELNLKLSEQDASYFLRHTLLVDGSVSYNVRNVSVEDSTGRMFYIKNIAYEEIDGAFVPTFFEHVVFDSEDKIDYQSLVQIQQSEINTAIPEDIFTLEGLGLEDGVRVSDRINKMEYWYRGGRLVIADKKTEQIISEEIDENVEGLEIVKKQVFLPEPVYALKSGKPYVFDFANEQFVETPIKDITSKDVYDYLVDAGKGDVAWKDGGLLGLRKAKIIYDEEKNENIQHFAEEWCNWYYFSKSKNIPFSLNFVASSGAIYEMTITEIKSDGVKMEYKKIP